MPVWTRKRKSPEGEKPTLGTSKAGDAVIGTPTPLQTPLQQTTTSSSVVPLKQRHAVTSRAGLPHAKIKVITNKDELPKFERVFGVENGKFIFREGVRSGAAGLVHIDGTATILIATDHTHILEAFRVHLINGGVKPGTVMYAESDFIFALYTNSTALVEKRQQLSNNASPAESQKVLNSIVQKAMDLNASDIHIHVLDKAKPAVSSVKFRIHGEFLLQKDLLTDPHTAHAICRAAYTGDSTDTASRSDTTFKTSDGLYATLQIPAIKNVRLRLQTMPHVLGYGMNLRVLSYEGLLDRYPNLVSMGFSTEHEKEIIDAFGTERGGLILFIAGTGEGKTTTVMTAIPMERKFESRNWISIEDPVEIINPKIFQSPVKRQTGMKADDSEHQAAMANSLRFDPDGIVAGEIRDEITVKMAERAAMTGHVTAATLHGNDVFGAFNRMIDLGARKINLLDGVARLFCHQKLVQTICQHCSTRAVESTNLTVKTFIQELVLTYGVDPSKVRLRGCGCEHCYPPGHALAGIGGRTVVGEVVRFNRQIYDALRKSDDTEDARHVWRLQRVSEYHEEGTLGKTLGEHALYKLLKGEIEPSVYIGVADSFDTHIPIPIQRSRRAVA